ncbi:transcription initiation factor TFIID subunit 7-like [Galleria mellonella]|uniref:Transcription initiation factor TFIID subunit 7 n=1 Tax=Galleria mellonella TaxID=7137 RepID=A0ABM3MY35_GALME|nr:transcription initiation factor TFIID subunit 7 [Galleria mellonella]XP_052754591.1 transcription initiation factor TFIID subunit 7 [Galleria mellonella]XP_052756134.1 transcription initiation factor TFIID subunit 7-like [Galleria mellonella]XP_052756135.1 transcription initiation factor TFIID subunit 7-like [Galleria mellonella]
MNKDKREPEYPVELESQFILRLPEEPAKSLRTALNSGENFKNRLTIKIENDMRHGEVRFDHWLLYGKIVDLPTIVESLKTIDRKSIYKTADICQIMICKEELDPSSTEDESPTKNKKKDPFKVDKKFLWPHGITPPTKNVRRRRFRKTLKKKCAEAPEIEKEVKRLLRADNEAVSYTWEIIKEEDDQNMKPEPSTSFKGDKVKKKQKVKVETKISNDSSSKVEDIFGGSLSDSDLEDENVNIDVDDSRLSCDDLSDSFHVTGDLKNKQYTPHFGSEFYPSQRSHNISETYESSSQGGQNMDYSLEDSLTQPNENSVMSQLQQLSADLEELKERRHRTQQEIAGMENMTLKQRFQDILQNLNKEIMYKELEYQNLLTK